MILFKYLFDTNSSILSTNICIRYNVIEKIIIMDLIVVNLVVKDKNKKISFKDIFCISKMTK